MKNENINCYFVSLLVSPPNRQAPTLLSLIRLFPANRFAIPEKTLYLQPEKRAYKMPHTEQQSQHAAKPFLKWAGGKSQLLAQFDQYLPESLEERDFYLHRALRGRWSYVIPYAAEVPQYQACGYQRHQSAPRRLL